MEKISDNDALGLIEADKRVTFERMREKLDRFMAEGDKAIEALMFVFDIDRKVAESLTKTAWSVKNSYVENEEILINLGVDSKAIRTLVELGKNLNRKMVDSSLKKVGRGDEDPIYVKMAIDLARAKRDLSLRDQEGYRSLGRKSFDRAIAWELKERDVKLTEGSRYSQAPVSFEDQQTIWLELLGLSI